MRSPLQVSLQQLLRLMTASALILPSVTPTSANAETPKQCAQVSAHTCATARAMARGLSMGSMLEAPNEGDWGLRLDSKFAAVLRDQFQTVRIPIRWSNHASPTAEAKIDPVFLRRVTKAVDTFIAAGMYVIIDVHHYQQLMGHPLHPGETRVEDNVLDERFYNIWRQLSVHFKGYSERLIFELLNEPAGRIKYSEWNSMIPKALDIVRETNPDRVVLIGPADWNSIKALPNLKIPPDKNVIVSVHNYDPFLFTHQGATWLPMKVPSGVKCCDGAQRSEVISALNAASDWSVKHGRPVYLGEFGAYRSADEASRANYARLVRTEAEKRGISWAYWDFAGSFGIYYPKTGFWAPGMLEALVD